MKTAVDNYNEPVVTDGVQLKKWTKAPLKKQTNHIIHIETCLKGNI